MARKKTKRYDDGGDITVTGKRESGLNPFAGLTPEGIRRTIGAGAEATGGGGSGIGIMDSPRNELGIGKTYSPVGKVYGPRYSGDGFSISGGYGPRGNPDTQGRRGPVVGGRYEQEGFSAGLGYDPRRNYVGGDVSLSFKKGGKVKKMAKGGAVKTSSASKRADGCAVKGKTKGRFV